MRKEGRGGAGKGGGGRRGQRSQTLSTSAQGRRSSVVLLNTRVNLGNKPNANGHN